MRLKSFLPFAFLPSVLAAVGFNRTNTTHSAFFSNPSFPLPPPCLSLLCYLFLVCQILTISSHTSVLTVFNDRLTFSLNTTLGAMTELHYDGVDLLGPVTGRIGMAYFDGYVIPAINASGRCLCCCFHKNI